MDKKRQERTLFLKPLPAQEQIKQYNMEHRCPYPHDNGRLYLYFFKNPSSYTIGRNLSPNALYKSLNSFSSFGI